MSVAESGISRRGFLGLVAASPLIITAACSPASPDVYITDPPEGNTVLYHQPVEGGYSNVRQDFSIWVFVRDQGSSLYHPQTGPAIKNESLQHWRVEDVRFGVSATVVGKSYHLTPAIADTEASLRLREYLQESGEQNSFSGFLRENLHPGVTLFPNEVTVWR